MNPLPSRSCLPHPSQETVEGSLRYAGLELGAELDLAQSHISIEMEAGIHWLTREKPGMKLTGVEGLAVASLMLDAIECAPS